MQPLGTSQYVGGDGGGGKSKGKREPENVSHEFAHELAQLPTHTWERLKEA